MFSPGDIVAPFGLLESWTGRVTAVWPAIGMVDVETAAGNKRYPAESLQEYVGGNAAPPKTNSTPGGDYWAGVPATKSASSKRVVETFKKKALFAKGALYWAGEDRQYRMTRAESEGDCLFCPRCKETPSPLSKAIYKRRGGRSEKLLGCKNCLFLIKDSDIINLNKPVSGIEVEAKTIKKSAVQDRMDYGTTYQERAQRKHVVYSRGGLKGALERAQNQNPGMDVVDLLLVATDHLGVDEWVYNTRKK